MALLVLKMHLTQVSSHCLSLGGVGEDLGVYLILGGVKGGGEVHSGRAVFLFSFFVISLYKHTSVICNCYI